MNKIHIHKQCGILSAYGLGLADVVQDKEEPIKADLVDGIVEKSIANRFQHMKELNEKTLTEVGFTLDQVKSQSYLNLRYIGTDTSIMIEHPTDIESGKTIESAYADSFYK